MSKLEIGLNNGWLCVGSGFEPNKELGPQVMQNVVNWSKRKAKSFTVKEVIPVDADGVAIQDPDATLCRVYVECFDKADEGEVKVENCRPKFSELETANMGAETFKKRHAAGALQALINLHREHGTGEIVSIEPTAPVRRKNKPDATYRVNIAEQTKAKTLEVYGHVLHYEGATERFV